MALISAIMDTTHFEIKHPCDTSINGLYHRGMIDSLIDLSQCRIIKLWRSLRDHKKYVWALRSSKSLHHTSYIIGHEILRDLTTIASFS